jgi:hypothetical protein
MNTTALQYGLGMATIDATAFSIVKYVSLGLHPLWMIIPMIMYGATPLILLKSLQKETLTVMNVLWDVSSDMLVTAIGLLYFNETLSLTKLAGVLLSFISIGLLTSC